MTFTPLVSPAVTPIDPNLRFPEQTVHAEYFSPLTSPAIEAQNSHNTRKRTHPHSSKRPNGSITSPTDPPPETQTLPSSTRNTSKNNNRRPSVTGKAPGRTVRQSPLTKPQARRKHPPLNISSAGLTELAEQSQVVVPSAGLSPSHQGPSTSSDGSGQSSISPEPLSDALMPPPTLPRSAGKSPNIVGKSQGPTGANEPATPATLMRLQNQTSSPQTRAQGSGRIHARENEHMEDMMLPESAASTHSLTPLTIDTSKAVVDDEITPTLSAKTPKLTSTSTPRMSAMRAQVKSPSTDTAHNHKRTESRSGHSTKSRQGSVVSHVSPAIRPKISPSIKPLIPQSSKSL